MKKRARSMRRQKNKTLFVRRGKKLVPRAARRALFPPMPGVK